MYQQISVIGRCGKDLEENKGVGKFSVVTNRTWKDRDGNKHDKAEWFYCTLFGKRVEGVGRFIEKGKMIHLTGRLESREYNDKTYWDLIVSDITLLGSKSDNPQTNKEDTQPAPSLDDIPF